jgi:hypothetical protein
MDTLTSIETYLRRNGLGELCERSDNTDAAARREARGCAAFLLLVASVIGGAFVSQALLYVGFAIAWVLYAGRYTERGDRPGPAWLEWGSSLILFVLYALLLWRGGPEPLGEALLVAALFVVSTQIGSYFFRTSASALAWNTFRAMRRGLATSVAATARGIPVVFVVLLAIFFTSDAWRFLTTPSPPRYWSFVAVLTLLTVSIALASVRPEARKLRDFNFPESMPDLAAHTPALPLVAAVDVTDVTQERLSRRSAQRNVDLSVGAVVIARIAAIGVASGLLFAIIGALLANRSFEADLLHRSPHSVVTVGGIFVSTELLRVALVLALLASASIATLVLTEHDYREQFIDDQLRRLREALAAWAYYAAEVKIRAALVTIPDVTEAESIDGASGTPAGG